MLETSAQRSQFRRKLLNWFDKNQRALPWRENRTPYRIWVSEIMLQQTQVATVINYYHRFMERFPDVASLAAGTEPEVLKLWEGLGYYRRARQLHAAAKQVCEQHEGVFPETFEDVLALPGIGRYTAGAILSIALDQRHPILEGNTQRLFARLMLLEEDPKSKETFFWVRALWESLLPRTRCGAFNQALMELGSLICRPKGPNCTQCPVSAHCEAISRGKQDSIPISTKGLKYESLHEAVLLVNRNRNGQQKFLVRLCEDGERWSGLWDFPRYQLKAGKSDLSDLSGQLQKQFGLDVALNAKDYRLKHAVTKYRITLDVFSCQRVSGRLKKQGQVTWATVAELAQLAMSATGRKIVNRLIAAEDDQS